MTDLTVRIEIALVPDPAWQDILQILMSSKKQENPPVPASQSQPPDPLKQIEPPKEYTTPTNQKVPGQLLEYSETLDGRLYIRYLSGRLYTTWDEIQRAVELLNNNNCPINSLLPSGTEEQKSALEQFCKAYSDKKVKPASVGEIPRSTKIKDQLQEVKAKINFIKQIDRFPADLAVSPLPTPVSGYINLKYLETKDGRLCIMYGSYKIFTTWDEIHRIIREDPDLKNYEKYLNVKSKNRRMGFNQFVKSVKSGQVKQFSEKNDPDKDFRPFGIAQAVYPPPNCSGDFGKVEE